MSPARDTRPAGNAFLPKIIEVSHPIGIEEISAPYTEPLHPVEGVHTCGIPHKLPEMTLHHLRSKIGTLRSHVGEQFRMGKCCKQSLPAATREPAHRTGLARKLRTET